MFDDKVLQQELTTRVRNVLEAGPAPDEGASLDGKYASDLDAMLAAEVALQGCLRERGLDDGFFLTETPDYHYPPLSLYDEKLATELGQLIGEVMIAVNPGAYVSRACKTPCINTKKRKEPFVFKPLAPAASWDAVGDGSIDYTVIDDGELKPMHGYGLKRFRVADSVWIDLFANDYPHAEQDEHGNPVSATLWTAELHAPQAKAPIMGMVGPGWFVNTWFEQNPTLKRALRTYPQVTEHEAWAKMYDWWMNAAWRYL